MGVMDHSWTPLLHHAYGTPEPVSGEPSSPWLGPHAHNVPFLGSLCPEKVSAEDASSEVPPFPQALSSPTSDVSLCPPQR